MKHTVIKTLLIASLLMTLVAGCDSGSDDVDILYGPSASIGEGTARLYLHLNEDGITDAVGLVLSEDALSGLPDGSGNMGHVMEHSTILRFPSRAQKDGIPFDHVSLDWNPNGHEPDGLFTLPHFDMHFYLTTEAERMTWVPTDPQFAQKGAFLPEAAYIPEGYFLPPGSETVPMMGMHWVDSSDPTYAPGGPTFSEVLIWGSYNGEIVFIEPMITRAYLESRPNFVETLAKPQTFARAGAYPTTYSVRYDDARQEYRIELGGLVRHVAD